jgi:hypothetical protein
LNVVDYFLNGVQSKHQIVLTWRQENSYNEALHLYPFVDNRLVPDIAFMIGPIKNLAWCCCHPWLIKFFPIVPIDNTKGNVVFG